MPKTGEDEGQADSSNDSDAQLHRVKKTFHVEVLHVSANGSSTVLLFSVF